MKGIYAMKKSNSDNESVRKRGSEKGTFIIKIDHSQNGTYQGQLIWAEGNKSKRFRSALEMIRMMDDIMKKGQEQQGEGWKSSIS
jgi:hypothetical protein